MRPSFFVGDYAVADEFFDQRIRQQLSSFRYLSLDHMADLAHQGVPPVQNAPVLNQRPGESPGGEQNQGRRMPTPGNTWPIWRIGSPPFCGMCRWCSARIVFIFIHNLILLLLLLLCKFYFSNKT